MARSRTQKWQMHRKKAWIPSSQHQSRLRLKRNRRRNRLITTPKPLLTRANRPTARLSYHRKPQITLLRVKLVLLLNHDPPRRLPLPKQHPLKLLIPEDKRVSRNLLNLNQIERLLEAKPHALSSIRRLFLIARRGGCHHGPTLWMIEGIVHPTMGDQVACRVITISIDHLNRLLVTAGVLGALIGTSTRDRFQMSHPARPIIATDHLVPALLIPVKTSPVHGLVRKHILIVQISSMMFRIGLVMAIVAGSNRARKKMIGGLYQTGLRLHQSQTFLAVLNAFLMLANLELMRHFPAVKTCHGAREAIDRHELPWRVPIPVTQGLVQISLQGDRDKLI